MGDSAFGPARSINKPTQPEKYLSELTRALEDTTKVIEGKR